MKIIFFSIALIVGMSNTVTAQDIFNLLKSEDLRDEDMYQNGVWYTDQYEGVFTCYIGKNKAEVDAFMSELAKLMDINLKRPSLKTREASYYKSALCRGMEVKWTKLLYDEYMLIVRIYL